MTPFKTLLRIAARLQKNWSTGTDRARDEAADVERIGVQWQRVQQSLGVKGNHRQDHFSTGVRFKIPYGQLVSNAPFPSA